MKLLLLLFLCLGAVAKHRILLHDVTQSVAEEFATRHGFDTPIRIFPTANIFSLSRDVMMREEAIDSAFTYYEDTELERVHRGGSTFSRPTDRLYGSAWFLHGQEMFYSNTTVHMGIEEAWAQGYMGGNLSALVLDHGLFPNHPDIAPNFNERISYNFITESADVRPDQIYAFLNHGHASAAVLAGSADGTCSVGVAPKAKVGMATILGSILTESMEARAHVLGLYAPATNGTDQVVQVLSLSYGPPDGYRLGHMTNLVKQARMLLFTLGRHGRGTPIFVAAGNGAGVKDNVNFDETASHWTTNAIGAVMADGRRAEYSERGSCLFLVAGSSGFSRGVSRGVVTSSPTASDYAACTHDFGGTSAAAPQIAALALLAIEANPHLTVQDIRHVLILAANASRSEIGLFSPIGWVLNSANYSHSLDYGFGLPRAKHVIRYAKEHTNLPQTVEKNYDFLGFPYNLTSGSSQPFTVHVSPYDIGDCEILQYVRLGIDATIPNGIQDIMSITLTSPHGTTAVLVEENRKVNTIFQMELGSWVQYGERSVGPWVVVVRAKSEVYIRSLTLRLQGYSAGE